MKQVLLLVVTIGCGAKPNAPLSSAGNPKTDAAAPSPVASDVGETPKASPAIPPSATCVPPDGSRRLDLGRIGTAIVVCVTDPGAAPAACWDLDAKSGAVTARTPAPLPGRSFSLDAKPGCYQGLCWPKAGPGTDETGETVYLAYHPDGARAAILAHMQIAIFDLASKKLTAHFPLRKAGDRVGRNEIGNTPTDLWFLGDFVFVRGDDAGPYSAVFRYTLDGTARGASADIYNGTATVADDHHLAINEAGLSKLTLIDGQGAARTLKRTLPPGCKPGELAEWDDDQLAASKTCGNYVKTYLRPFAKLEIIANGTEFLGLDPQTRTLFAVDAATLAPRALGTLATCK